TMSFRLKFPNIGFNPRNRHGGQGPERTCMTEHGHDHDHERTVAPMVDEVTDFEVLEIALRELCIEKGIFSAEEHRLMTEFAEQIGPTPEARLVAKAWLDPKFKELALAEPMTASKEVGVDWL